VVAENTIAQVIHAFRYRYNHCFFLMEGKAQSQKIFLHRLPDCPKPLLVIVDDRDVVHIADIFPAMEDFFHIMVKAVEINIGEKLTGQVADRYAAPPLKGRKKIVSLIVSVNFLLRIAGSDDKIYQPQGVATFDFPGDTFKEDFVVNGGEIFSDVCLQDIATLSGKLREAIHGAVRALTGAAGIGIMDERPFKMGSITRHRA